MKLVEREKTETLKNWVEGLGLKVVDTYGIGFDYSEYNVENYNNTAIGHYKYSSEYEAYSIKLEISRLLECGKGIYIDGYVYFKESLIGELVNGNLIYLEDYIINAKRRIDEDLSVYTKYLKEPYKDYGIVMTQELMYKLGNISSEKMQEKAIKYAHDPEGFMEHMELIKSGERPMSYTLYKEEKSYVAC